MKYNVLKLYITLILVFIHRIVFSQTNFWDELDKLPILGKGEQSVFSSLYTADPYVRSVQMYMGVPGNLPVKSVTSLEKIILEFDDITDSPSDIFAEVIHCNSDWKPSGEYETEYLSEFNEFRINQYRISHNTFVPYVHYVFEVPRVKISGNYLLRVYAGSPSNGDFLFETWFVVYEPMVIPETTFIKRVPGDVRDNLQQVKLKLSYRDLPIEEASQRMTASIIQNQRWDNAIVDMKPAFVNEAFQEVDFSFLSSGTFSGGHEYRYCDFRFFQSPGFKVDRIFRGDFMHDVYLIKDWSRAGNAYSSPRRDQNGKYMVSRWDALESRNEADYAMVHFFMESKILPKRDVYVVGAFSGYQPLEEYKLVYDEKAGGYYGKVMLKQGVYNYQYAVFDRELGHMNVKETEGNHWETLNDYHVFIYYRGYGMRSDRVIGFGKVSWY